MSKRHQANRRRTYGRRQHELRERQDRVWPDGAGRGRPVEDGFAAVDGAIAEQAGPSYARSGSGGVVAGYAGARPRTGVLGRRVAPPAGESRGRAADRDAFAAPGPRAASSAAPGGGRARTGILIAGIVVAFGLGFFSLAQTVRVSATDVEVDRILAERQILLAEQDQLRADLYRARPRARHSEAGPGRRSGAARRPARSFPAR